MHVASSPVEPTRPVYGPPAVLNGRGTRANSGAAGGTAAAQTIETEAVLPAREPADEPAPAVVVAGSAARILDREEPRGWRLGGGAAHGALLLGRLGLRVGVVLGVDAQAALASELDLLREASVDLRLVQLPTGPVLDQPPTAGGTLASWEEVGAPLPVAALPPPWRTAPGWYFAPVADELPDGWAAVPPGAVVAVAWQGLLRQLERGAPARPRAAGPRALLRRADLVAVASEDLDPATELGGLLRLLRIGALCTLHCGTRGGLVVTVVPGSPRMRRFPSQRVEPAAGTSEIGDPFLAALLAARVAPALAGRQPHLSAALRFAEAVRSAYQGAGGLAGVPTLAQVRSRLREAGPS
jgi:sugar/nucleoside kinase (ribokinase family)